MTAATLGRDVRPEIQALRAVAVVLVLVYHWWPSSLRGGFVGVDVFFAISGYLITAHLLREVDATGRVALLGFWARRARRILPAALLVLLFCALATVAFVPRLQWEPFLTEIRASTLYVENWHLAREAVDYLAVDDAPTPVQHFWSLSAEEQFYLVWPVLILAGAAVGRRAIAVVLWVVTLASFGWSVYLTEADPAAAYFVTPTRAWEFGAGGLLALASASSRPRPALSWAGLVAIAVAAVGFSASTPFPGVAALLPVLGAVAVMWAAAPSVLLTPRPVQLTGDISYSLYLWHWPLLVLAPFVLDRALTTADLVLLLVLTFVLGWVTKVAVEDPVRRGAFLVARRPVWTFATMGTGTILVLGLSAAGESDVRRRVAEARKGTVRILERPPSCFGAAARDPRRSCDARPLRLTVVPTPIEARGSPNAPCTRVERTGLLNVCAFGARKAQARRTIALIGDSHASHWRAAVDVAAEARRWRGLSIAHTDCPLSMAVRDIPEPRRSECVRWREEVLAWLAAHPEVRTVFVGQSVAGRVLAPPGVSQFAAQVEGYREAWRRVPRSVERIVVLRDTPRALPRGATLECVEDAIRDRRPAGEACALPRSRALRRDPAAAAAGAPRVRVVDLTRFFCDARRCFAVVGGALVHRDVSHMTTVFGATLGRYLLRALG